MLIENVDEVKLQKNIKYVLHQHHLPTVESDLLQMIHLQATFIEE